MQKTKKKSFLFRMAAMMMAAFTLAVIMTCTAVSAMAAEENTAVYAEETETADALTEDSAASVSFADVYNAVVGGLSDGFAITAAADDAGSNLSDQTDGDDQFSDVVAFFVKWIKRVGLLVAFVGGVMFALAIKNNDAEQKQAGLLTLVAGFVVSALCQAVDMFGITD